MVLVLYSRRGCHLCEEAEDLLSARRCRLDVVDVDADPATRAAYGDRVPVLVRDGSVLMEGRFDEPTLVRLLGDGPGA